MKKKINLQEVQVSEDDYNLYKNIFESIDTDKGGYLDFDEVKSWALKMNKNYDETQIDSILSGMDENGDRTVDMDEFIKFMALLSTPPETKELRKYYDLIDDGGNGYVSREELLQFYKKMGFAVQMKDINSIYDTMQLGKEEDLTFQKFYTIFDFNKENLNDYGSKTNTQADEQPGEKKESMKNESVTSSSSKNK